jgi:hypothetical protein
MNFEVFDGSNAGAGRGTPSIRILGGGRLVLNAAAQRLLGETAFVQLLWDADTKRIGLKATDQSDTKGFRVTVAPSQSIITSKAFVEAHDIPLSLRMLLAWEGTMWVASTINPDAPLKEGPGRIW